MSRVVLMMQRWQSSLAPAMAVRAQFLLISPYLDRRPRSQRLLQEHARADDRAAVARQAPRGLAQRARRNRARAGLRHAVPAAVHRGSAANHGLHAGPAGGHALAERGPQPHHPGRRDGPAATRPLGRSGAADPCRRMHRTSAADAARDLAGDGRWRPPDRRGANARRSVVADRPLALLSGPSLFPRPARCLMRANMFAPLQQTRALFMPPTRSRLMMRMAPAVE